MRVRPRVFWSYFLTTTCALSVTLAFAVTAGSGAGRAVSTSAEQEREQTQTPGTSTLAVQTNRSSYPHTGNKGTQSAGPARVVQFAGRRFQIPDGWSVTDLTADPTACVRFDRHTVYIGTPGPQQRCPAQGVARPAGAMLISASSSTTGNRLVQDEASHSIEASAPGVTVEASYGDDPSQVLQILDSAQLNAGATPTESAPGVAGSTQASPSTIGPRTVVTTSGAVPTTDGMAGLGFDACAAPSSAAMQAWGASPFTTVGIYLGGADRACAQPNLTAAWVAQQATAGWHFLPLYAGPQALYGQITAPQSQAVQAADDAVAQAAALGFTRGSVLYYDLEAYPTSDSAVAVAFMSAWTQEVHNQGYLSGIYSSENSGIADLMANWGTITEPDVIDVANWNGQADSDPGADPAGHWTGRRVHQYLGGTNDSPTYGGVTINIDQDYLSLDGIRCEILVVPATPSSTGTAAGALTSHLPACVATSR